MFSNHIRPFSYLRTVSVQPLKILQIANRIPFPLTDGGNIATYNVTRFLSTFGHKVTLATLNTLKHYQDPAVLSAICKVKAVEHDTSITPWGLALSLVQKMPYNVKRFWSDEFETMLADLLQEETYDVIQMEGIYLALYSDVVRHYSKAPLILRSHNIEHEIWQRMSEHDTNPLKRWYYGMLTRKIKAFEEKHLHDFDAIVAITDRDAEYYRKHQYKGQLVTINAGVDLHKFIPAKTEPEPATLCFLAGMEWLPNQQGLDWFLAEVWPLLKKQYPTLSLHIAGKAMPAHYFKLQLPDVKVHGMVSDAVDYLRKYEIFIVPLLSGGGMRLKIVEGLALGKCIVSTSVGAEGVAYQNGKDILIADSPKEWIDAVGKVMSQSDLSSSIGREAIVLAH